MKFPRNARIFPGHLDVAPFAMVFFLLLIFLMLSTLVYTPGVRLQLPVAAGDLPGSDKPMVSVALDAKGRLYYQNQVIDEGPLREQLREAATKTPGLVLLIEADEGVTQKQLFGLTLLAREAGITDNWLAARPRPLSSSP